MVKTAKRGGLPLGQPLRLPIDHLKQGALWSGEPVEKGRTDAPIAVIAAMLTAAHGKRRRRSARFTDGHAND
jgi:hypothetical protein